MARWIYIIGTNCKEPAKEKNFNEWYDMIHIPDMLTLNNLIKSAARYERKDPQGNAAKYLVVYELETDDIDASMAEFARHVESLREKGKISDQVAVVTKELYKKL